MKTQTPTRKPIKHTSDFLDMLQSELVKRCQKNQKYSLRAFAQSLDLSPSFLSKLLTGKRPLTEGTFRKLAGKLLLSPQEFEAYNYQVSRTPKVALSQAFHQVQLDKFEFIAEWYHFAILELISLPSFRDDMHWIAKELNINYHQASDAIQRLLRMGFLERKKGQLRLIRRNNTTIGAEVAVPATTKQQTQFLKMAIQALEDIPIDQRSQTSMTMAIPRSKLGCANELITDFRRNMTSLLQKSSERDSVYQLVISFYPLTTNK